MIDGQDVAGGLLLKHADPALSALKKAGRHAEVVALIDRLEARFPLSFGACRPSFELERFESATRLPGADWAAEARRLGPHAGSLAEVVSGLPTRMAWEGHAEAALAFVDGARKSLQRGEGAPAEESWLTRAIELRVLTHLDRDPDLASDDPSLLASLAPLASEGRALDEIRTHAMVWLALLRPAGDEAIVQPDLLKLGKKGTEAGVRQVSRLAAGAAARLRERAGWTRGQSWVLLRELGPLLDECAEVTHERKGKADAASLLLPPPALLLSRLNSRNHSLFHRSHHEVAAVTLALSAWAGAVAEGGWASDKHAQDWQRQAMGESHRDWAATPERERDTLACQVLAFTERERTKGEARPC